MKIIGGTYFERVQSPDYYELYGSGLRAAAWLSGVDDISLATVCYADSLSLARQKSALYGFRLDEVPWRGSRAPVFRYETPLTGATYYEDFEKRLSELPEFFDDVVLQFGMLEGHGKVHGRRVVYDPQSPCAPEGFYESGSSATELVMILNASEARALWGEMSWEETISREFGAHSTLKGVIVKNGPFGARLYDRSNPSGRFIPAYRSDSVFPVGSGDIYSATFAHYWGVENLPMAEAADMASRAVSVYVQSRGVVSPMRPDAVISETFIPVPERGYSELGSVYLAAPFFNSVDVIAVNRMFELFTEHCIPVFSPYHRVGLGDASRVYGADIEGLKAAKVVFANVCGFDPGTVYEVGYAAALKKPVVVYAEGCGVEHLTMFCGCRVYTDLSAAFYNVVWSLLES